VLDIRGRRVPSPSCWRWALDNQAHLGVSPRSQLDLSVWYSRQCSTVRRWRQLHRSLMNRWWVIRPHWSQHLDYQQIRPRMLRQPSRQHSLRYRCFAPER
jgi:hypothetical protein